MKISLRTKNIAGIAAIEGLLLISLVFTAINFSLHIIDEMLSKRASTTADLFAHMVKDAVLSYDLNSLESFAEELMKKPDIKYVKIIGPEQQTLTSVGQYNVLSRDFLEDQRLSDVNDGVFDTFATIDASAPLLGRVELGINIHSTQAAIAKVVAWSISIATIQIVLVATFSYFFSTFVYSQLRDAKRSFRQLQKTRKDGDFNLFSLLLGAKENMPELAKAANDKILSLQQDIEANRKQKNEIIKSKDKLEKKVVEQTRQIKDQIEQLKKSSEKNKKTQQQLIQAEKMSSVGQLVAGVAHEINNPIGFVASNMSTLKDYVSAYQLLVHQSQLVVQELSQQTNPQLQVLSEMLSKQNFVFINEDIEELITDSKDGLARVAKIVEDLKVFSRINKNDKQLFDINTCIKTSLNIVKNELKYNCDIVTELGVIPEIMMNVGKLTQVFTNLLINASHAIKATDTFGKVVVSTSLSKNHIVIQIEDSGIGIPSDSLNKIFAPFFTTKPEDLGTGLGLSVSKDIIAELDGEINAESEVGKGSCFTIKLPVTRTEEA